MAEIDLKIEGMHCGACATGIQMIAMGLEGVTKAFVDYDKKTGTFTFDESKSSKEKIIEEIGKSGYKVS